MTAISPSYTSSPASDLSTSGDYVLDLLKVFSHDCRNDLVSMGAALALLEKGFSGTFPD
jgi:hypothetical protein